jgi:hypothetical protein
LTFKVKKNTKKKDSIFFKEKVFFLFFLVKELFILLGKKTCFIINYKINFKMTERDRFEDIYRAKIAMNGGLSIGGYDSDEDGGRMPKGSKAYKTSSKGPSGKMRGVAYAVPFQSGQQRAAAQNPWVRFVKAHSIATGMRYTDAAYDVGQHGPNHHLYLAFRADHIRKTPVRHFGPVLAHKKPTTKAAIQKHHKALATSSPVAHRMYQKLYEKDGKKKRSAIKKHKHRKAKIHKLKRKMEKKPHKAKKYQSKLVMLEAKHKKHFKKHKEEITKIKAENKALKKQNKALKAKLAKKA